MEGNSSNPNPGDPAASQARHSAFDDARMDLIMGRLLQVGVLLAAGIVLAGGALYLVQNPAGRADYRTFTAHPMLLCHPSELLHGLARADAAAIVELGILLLVATPICRVAFAVAAFAIERDRLYVAISLTVLTVLLLGMLRGG
jgi:uncharacterized membrane protein